MVSHRMSTPVSCADRPGLTHRTAAARRRPQIEYPKNVHLLRGNHEAADINALFGFRVECVERLGEKRISAARDSRRRALTTGRIHSRLAAHRRGRRALGVGPLQHRVQHDAARGRD